MRVLLLPSSYPPVLGGLQTVAHMLAQHLGQRGHGVRVVTNRYPRSLPDHELRDGVPVSRWHFLRPNSGYLRSGRPELFLASLYYQPSTYFRLSRLMQTFLPDVMNVHFPDAQIPFVLGLRRRFGFRLVVSLHGHEIERFTGPDDSGPRRAMHDPDCGMKKLLREADAVTACSRHLLENAIRLEPSVWAKGRAIYNGIDPDRFQDKVPYSHGRPYILGFGRLTRKKGFDLLLEAFARLGAQCRGVDLILAGEGEERGALIAQAQHLGVERTVRFFGRATSGEVVRLLNGSLFLVVPSRMEPFGIVALEGLAAGKPVLATNVGGLREMLTEVRRSSGSRKREVPTMLVDPTVEGLLQGMREWLSTEPLQNQQSPSNAAVLKDYSWANVAQTYERVLTGL
jgi:glycosyltransferase involved in cell wall biosynthesis